MIERDMKTAAEVAALLAAPTLFAQYAIATLIVALAERRAIEPERVFQLFRVIVDGFESGRIQPPESSRMAAEMLKGVETTFRNLVTIPAGAGRA